jgi:hypothetical protein
METNQLNPAAPQKSAEPLAHGELPALGAHLVTPWFGFLHHGIYVGDGKVVHYGALMYDIIRRPVEEVTLERFAEGRPVFVVEHPRTRFAADEIIRRARSRLGEDKYRLLSNNCEHFCHWCLHDEHRSFQVETALAFGKLMGEWWRFKLSSLARQWLTIRAPARARIEGDKRLNPRS